MNNSCFHCGIKSSAAKELSTEEISELDRNCSMASFKKGDCILKQGALSSNVIYLKTGLVKVHLKGPLFEQITRITKAPSYLGLPTTLGDKINNYSVTAIEGSEVCFISNEIFKKFILINDKFAYEIIVELCKRELQSFQRCVNRTQKQVRGSIAENLLYFADEIYNSQEFDLPLSRSEFGNLVDTSRESVSRILSEFNTDKLIEITGKKIKILNKELLELISKHG